MFTASFPRNLRAITPKQPWICPKCQSKAGLRQAVFTTPRGTPGLSARAFYFGSAPEGVVPFRKQLKDEVKQKRLAGDDKAKRKRGEGKNPRLEKWELTVGIEIHAQLNTERKLFSRAATSVNDQPNSHVSLFDLAFPGSQPEFQRATLLPAIRAGVALNCSISRHSSFDRKHYFYQDQPAGYQITQYYAPLARDGSITLYDHDGIAPEDGKVVTIQIKQIQMEQDTAKTIQQPPDTTLLDFNRVSYPLIEIITLPQIHHPQTAAACVRKIQALLQAVNAVTTGMEMGGLRADVNVSVRPKNDSSGPHEYYGITGLGQRTEIKNLSSFKAVEDAIIVERDRQIDVLEAGGVIEGETRGWTLGSTVTKKLRGKEGEVDYRYMPDPDLPPVIIGKDLIEHLRNTLPILPDASIQKLVNDLEITIKDAKTIVALDDGERLDYFYEVMACLQDSMNDPNSTEDFGKTQVYHKTARTAANWVTHELGGLLTASEEPFSANPVSADSLSRIIRTLLTNEITGRTAKQLLAMVFDGDERNIDAIIERENLRLVPLSRLQYMQMAEELIGDNEAMVTQIRKGQVGKLQWFVGQMMRKGEGMVEAEKAETVLREIVGVGGKK
ncbi:MAG: glutamyl-tRNA(Gln) B subunit [Lasallia pustulata]|uniref:Glutamyl-tRNA(Gln) amidotransferase subunit B, mitochondrial n=1 Tax=Lasallia pustulata TaxID=136370 RepID=A0A5M8PJA5_9LECA|nr:MAG: glutamyl-tRNA(Gln) B subunit [Lasallia pustulata]